ncbi:TPA: DNA mismatch repair protein MutS, partial [Candidatus Sumerlaeota bacterium]|nr:DNA mismatch repair protein MutS [Candidatus Sumerlaeota bacterium]
ITFLYKIIAGSADHSYGIYAGKIAGLPLPVIDRAKEILNQLEFGSNASGLPPATKSLPADRHVKLKPDANGMVQLSLFDGLDHPALEALRSTDINSLTPVQALQKLEELVNKARMW